MDWKKFITPAVIVMVITALIGVIYTGMASDIDEQKKKIEVLSEKKVDNDTLKMLIEQQSKLTEMQQKAIDDKFNMQQRTIEELIKKMPERNTEGDSQ